MKMKTKVTIAIISIVIIITLLFVFLPRQLISNENDISFIQIIKDGRDITNNIDQDAVISHLKNVKCAQSLSLPHGTTDSMKYEINITHKGSPLHIVLGDINICYEDASSFAYDIVDPEIIKSRLDEIIE